MPCRLQRPSVNDRTRKLLEAAVSRAGRAQWALKKGEEIVAGDRDNDSPVFSAAFVALQHAAEAATADASICAALLSADSPSETSPDLAATAAQHSTEAALALFAVMTGLSPSQQPAPSNGCSFCGKRGDEGVRLVHGPLVRICDECVTHAMAILGLPASAQP